MNGLNYEILNAIDNIEECTYQAEQDVFNSMVVEYEKSMMLLEYVEPDVYDEIIYQEGKSLQKSSTGLKNKAGNVLKKLWEGIKKALGLLIKGLKFVVNKIIQFFKKQKQTASQIAENVVGKNPQQATISGSNNNIKVIGGKNHLTIQMNVDPHSTHKPEPVRISSTEGLITKFTGAGEIEISTNFGTSFLKSLVVNNNQKGSGLNAKMVSARSYESIAQLHAIMYDSKINEEYFKLFEELSKIIKLLNNKPSESEQEDYGVKMGELIDDFNTLTVSAAEKILAIGVKDLDRYSKEVLGNAKMLSDESESDYKKRVARLPFEYNDKYAQIVRFKLSDIQQFTKRLNDLNNTCVQPISLNADIQLGMKSEKLKRCISTLLKVVNELQYSINVIMNMVSESFMIDTSYFKTINDPEKLDEFVSALIDAGIPSRYIGYNAWAVSGENITADSEFKPRWGQTRLCLLPNDKDICYKIALNGLGKTGNATEYKIYNDILKGCDVLCPCLKLYRTQSVVMSKRAEFIDDSNHNKSNIHDEIVDRLDDFTEDKPISINDIHGDNIGIIDGKYVVIDYGEFSWK